MPNNDPAAVAPPATDSPSPAETVPEIVPEPAPAQKPAKGAKSAAPVAPQVPTLGRVVLYNEFDPETGAAAPRMAHVCHVWSDIVVNLQVVRQDGTSYGVSSVTAGNGAGNWSWPLRT